MIRSLFVPDVIGSSFVFSQTIVGCEFNRTSIRLTVVIAKGTNRIIQTITEEYLENDATKSLSERYSTALKKAFAGIKKYDRVVLVLPNNVVIFKEFTVPFNDERKIKLILPFEIESQLPFPLHEATIDCIITKKSDKGATVLAVAIKNEILDEQREIFAVAGISLTHCTVDVIELYALYKTLHKDDSNVLLAYFGIDSIRLGVVIDGQLKASRYLSYGLQKLAKVTGIELDQLLRTGFVEDKDFTDAVASYLVDVKFTLEAFQTKLREGSSFSSCVIMGRGADVVGFNELVEKNLHISTTTLTMQKMLHNGITNIRSSVRIPNDFIISLSAALSLPLTMSFNLNQAYLGVVQQKQLRMQLLVASILALFLCGTIIFNMMLNVRRFTKEIQESERETVARIKKELPSLANRRELAGKTSLDTVNRLARNEVAREKNIWFALSPQNRASFLKYLQDLFTRIDPEGLGLNLKRLTMHEDSIMLEGHVRDYETLKRLEEDLRQSKMFVQVPKLEELTFTMKLPLDSSYRGNE